MADKPIQVVSGVLTEVEGKQSSAGAGDAGKIVALDSSGKIDSSMMPVGIGAATKTALASENLSAGDIVNLYNNSGTINARKADASGGTAKRANGFVLSAVTSGQNATVYLDGTITGLSSLTPGAAYFLSGTAGGVTTTAPTTATHICQKIGDAISTTEISVEIGEPIVRA
jgi:hypothetical protein